MTDLSHGPDPCAELLGVAGALYGALIRARPYVKATVDRRRTLPGETVVETDEALLERIDGALADAGEYLPGVTS